MQCRACSGSTVRRSCLQSNAALHQRQRSGRSSGVGHNSLPLHYTVSTVLFCDGVDGKHRISVPDRLAEDEPFCWWKTLTVRPGDCKLHGSITHSQTRKPKICLRFQHCRGSANVVWTTTNVNGKSWNSMIAIPFRDFAPDMRSCLLTASNSLQPSKGRWFDHQYTKRPPFSQGCTFRESWKTFYILPHLPQNGNFRHSFDGTTSSIRPNQKKDYTGKCP